MVAAAQEDGRRIGPVGTIVRIALGFTLIYMAMIDDGRFFEWNTYVGDALLGLLGFPFVMVVVALVAGRRLERPVRLVGPGGLMLNAALIFFLLVSHQTHDAALFFYGVSFPIAAWRGASGCEMTVISNMLLGRNDEIGCPVMAPVDAAEAALGRSGQEWQRADAHAPLEALICVVLMASLLWWFA